MTTRILKAASSASSPTAIPGFPIGSEFRVNTYTTGRQDEPVVTLGGDVVFAWSSEQDPDGSRGIYAQRHQRPVAARGPPGLHGRIAGTVNGGEEGRAVPVSHPDASGRASALAVLCGTPRGLRAQPGPEFRVNTYTTGAQRRPAVGNHGDDFVVAWESEAQDGDQSGIFARSYNPSGGPLGPEFQVDAYTTSAQHSPSIGGANSLSVIAWQSEGQDGSLAGIHARQSAPPGRRAASSGSTVTARPARSRPPWTRRPRATSWSSGPASARTEAITESSRSATPSTGPRRAPVPRQHLHHRFSGPSGGGHGAGRRVVRCALGRRGPRRFPPVSSANGTSPREPPSAPSSR